MRLISSAMPAPASATMAAASAGADGLITVTPIFNASYSPVRAAAGRVIAMTDYGREVRFGVFPSPETARLAETLAIAEIADDGGLDLVGIQDHPYQARFLDTWSLMAAVLARTSRVHVFPDVASLPLRSPAVLAKAAASLDVIYGGRFELGLGAGAFWPAIAAMGGPSRTPREAGRRWPRPST